MHLVVLDNLQNQPKFANQSTNTNYDDSTRARGTHPRLTPNAELKETYNHILFMENISKKLELPRKTWAVTINSSQLFDCK